MNKSAFLIGFTLTVLLIGNGYAQDNKKDSYRKFKSRSSFQSSAPALLKGVCHSGYSLIPRPRFVSG